MTLEEADVKARLLYGDNVFCAIDGCGRCEVFYKELGNINNCTLLGRGGDWDEAFEDAVLFSKRFYPELYELAIHPDA